MICPECGGEFKNLGAHKRFCSAKPQIKVDDYIKEKPLSSIIADIRDVLKSVQHEMTVKTVADNGVTKLVEITARFQIRR